MEEMQNQPVPEPGKTYSSKNNSFTILSLCFGMIAIATCSMFFIALPAGGLSILFAILSKGRERKMQAICKAGIITSAIGIFLSFLITGAAFYLCSPIRITGSSSMICHSRCTVKPLMIC